MRYALIIVALTALQGCGKDSPMAPTPPVVVTPQPITLSVHVTATNGGQALQGVAGELGGASGVTNGDGGLLLQTQPGSAQRLNLGGAGIVPRSIMVAVGATRAVDVDAISAAGFDLELYRQLVRGITDHSLPAALRRWTSNPSLFLQTGSVDATTLDMIERVARETIPVWTSNKVQVANVERGAGSREGQDGWITVQFAPVAGRCGQSDVARSGGVITLAPTNCGCSGLRIAPAVVRHEIGHSMGFWHTSNAADLMAPSFPRQCDMQPTARELSYAAIAYSRPVGNADPDSDPASVVTLAPMRVY